YRNNLLMLYKNLTQSHLYKVFMIRFLIDLVATLRFCLIGEFHSALSILKAYKDFFSIKNRYREKRKENLSLSIKGSEQLLYKYSILWKYFLKRKKTYSSLS
ncbi:MAG TPA: glycosyl transferase family 2, partial [Porphyromonadaceae bacterium]|nr:glycosyl transferase family 2 [Porphyromonadaceae bacterium]